ncbi:MULTISPECIES: DGQHR domain-containing protein [unclassified Oleiphilus]|uniref:DGQHR domain-containing protein n=1 Tax=unclassified Oleiphilus TaxID=2631174 RepID=UPI0007C3D003|nr:MULTISPECIES: DGQHR domain-containing protein [unclassified Oleiphilus]KZZ35386.1 hypothetical protein A3757_15800 [Oleiphilus sp. HI0117]KZZ56362.1 hypothetical protein A3761_09100 [Oleiphilus sp. HI0123]
MATNVFPCLRGVVGDWVYYSTVMTAEQISQKILRAHNIREAESLEEYLQRDITANVDKLVKYIDERDDRFFNSIIVGVFGGVPEWNSFSLAMVDELSNLGENEISYLEDSVGILKFDGNEEMFAIDGQHRVEAIKHAQSEGLASEDQFSVIFVAHNDDECGNRRTRRLFADINKKAVRVSNGDLAIIDEEDSHNIVARRLYSDYEHFMSGDLIALTKSGSLPANCVEQYTNLLTLASVNKILKPLHRNFRKKNWNDDDLNEMFDISKSFFDFVMMKITSVKRCIIDKQITIEEARFTENNLLFRPVGIMAMAEVYKAFYKSDRLDELETKVNEFDFSMDGAHLNNLIWNTGKLELKNKKVMIDFMLYMFGLIDEDIEGVSRSFRVATKGTRELPPAF